MWKQGGLELIDWWNEDFMVQSEITFQGIIKIVGVNPYVDVPDHLITKLNSKKVLLRLKRENDSSKKMKKTDKDREQLISIGRLTEDGWYRTTIVYMRNNPERLYLDTWMRDSVDVSVGDEVTIILKRDDESREIQIPELLDKALQENPIANDEWNRLSPSKQKEIKVYLNFLKSEDKLKDKVKETIKKLEQKG